MSSELTLIRHQLGPCAQHAAMVFSEKNVSFRRQDIDPVNRPDRVLRKSPPSKTLVSSAGSVPVPESGASLEILEKPQHAAPHPDDALERTRHRGWIEFGSSLLNDSAGIYNARTASAFRERAGQMRGKFDHIEAAFDHGSGFEGEWSALFDATFGRIFRYLGIFETIRAFDVFTDLLRGYAWWGARADRLCATTAGDPRYPEQLKAHPLSRGSYISGLILSQPAM